VLYYLCLLGWWRETVNGYVCASCLGPAPAKCNQRLDPKKWTLDFLGKKD